MKQTEVYRILDSNFQDVQVNWEPNQHNVPRDMQLEIEKFWDKVKNKNLHNGRLARLDSWSVENNILQLNLSITDYRTLLYSNQRIKRITEKWGNKYISNALGISAVVITNDNFIILMRRSKLVGEYPDRIDVFGGHIDITHDNKLIGIYHSMLTELEEELGVLPDEVDLKCIGLIKNIQNQKPELIFTAQSNMIVKELINKSQNAYDRFEIAKLIILPNIKDVLSSFLRIYEIRFSPSAFGSLELFINFNM